MTSKVFSSVKACIFLLLHSVLLTGLIDLLPTPRAIPQFKPRYTVSIFVSYESLKGFSLTEQFFCVGTK